MSEADKKTVHDLQQMAIETAEANECIEKAHREKEQAWIRELVEKYSANRVDDVSCPGPFLRTPHNIEVMETLRERPFNRHTQDFLGRPSLTVRQLAEVLKGLPDFLQDRPLVGHLKGVSIRMTSRGYFLVVLDMADFSLTEIEQEIVYEGARPPGATGQATDRRGR